MRVRLEDGKSELESDLPDANLVGVPKLTPAPRRARPRIPAPGMTKITLPPGAFGHAPLSLQLERSAEQNLWIGVVERDPAPGELRYVRAAENPAQQGQG